MNILKECVKNVIMENKMSATDYYFCPKCKNKVIDYVNKWILLIDNEYGKVDLSTWEMLVKCKALIIDYQKAWKNESESFKEPKDASKLFDYLEEHFEGDFDGCEIQGVENSFTTIRYDSDTAISDDGLLDMSETYDCQCCDFHIEISKIWKEGKNEEAK